MIFLTALSKVLPVFLLILLGAGLRRARFLQPGTVGDLRRLIVTVTLPAALFLAFARVALDATYLIVVAIIFAACWAVLLLGGPLGRALGIRWPVFASLLTGFEAGMLGYAIFSAVYGADAIWKFGIVDLGQVLFVFFVLVPGLQRLDAGGGGSFGATLRGFLKTPVILAILGGLAFQAAGLTALFAANPLLGGVLDALGLLGAMTTPLVTLVIGYELQLRPGALGKPLLAQGVRLLIWLPAGLLLAYGVVGGRLGLDTEFQAAALTLALLPAPFVIPIFRRAAEADEANFVTNTLTLGTLATLLLYALVPVLFPPG